MTPENFVKAFKAEKDILLKTYTDPSSGTSAAKIADELKSQLNNKEKMEELIETILTDTFYTILLGLDGCASIGGIQQNYQIKDEDGNLLTDGGELEGFAYEAFQT